jgi:uncharacterized protein (DUF2141 family)
MKFASAFLALFAVACSGQAASPHISDSPVGVIAGIVVDDQGDPVPEVSVTALRVSGKPDDASPQKIAQETTDDLGSYRLYDLPPGGYLVTVTRKSDPEDERDLSLLAEKPTIFFPGTMALSRARPIEVTAGSTIIGINFVLPADPLTASASSSRSSNAATIEGKVISITSGLAIRNARVRLYENDNKQGQALSTWSDSDGHFRFAWIDPGTYRIAASRTGYLRPHQPGTEPRSAGRQITLQAKETVDNVLLHLIPQAVIAGTVREKDVPVSNAVVVAARAVLSDGKSHLVLVRRAITNDLGEYRLFGMPPGHYSVSAFHEGKDSHAKDGEGEASALQSMNFTRAAEVDVAPDSVQCCVPLSIVREHPHAVSGTVALVPGVHFTRPPTILLYPHDLSRALRINDRSIPVDQRTGSFRVDGVPPGSYVLSIDAQAGSDPYATSMVVEVSNEDVVGLLAQLRRTFAVDGRVYVEDAKECGVSGLHISALSYGDQGPVYRATATVGRDGSFRLASLHPDGYSIAVTGLTGNCYVKSLTVGSANVSSNEVRLDEGSAPLELVLGNGGGSIDGLVADEQHTPVQASTVVLVPHPSAREGSGAYKTVSVDLSGKFSLRGLPPGEYRVIAFDELDSELYQDPDFPAEVENLGQAVSVPEFGHSVIQLTVEPHARRAP